MEQLVALGAGVLVIVLLVSMLAVWRIGRVVSWRALVMTARATGSFEGCVAYIRFCAEERGETRELARQHAISSLRPRMQPPEALRRAS